jgi:hypothetical protein
MKYLLSVVLCMVLVGCEADRQNSVERQYAELAKHPWWSVPMAPRRVAGIVQRITGLQRLADEKESEMKWPYIELTSDGNITDRVITVQTGNPSRMVKPWDIWSPKRITGEVEKTWAILGEIDNCSKMIVVKFNSGVPGCSEPISDQDARDLLQRMLDLAQDIQNQPDPEPKENPPPGRARLQG